MIIPSIDLRPALLPIRHQGRRRSCLAFACSSAHEHKAGTGEHLSVEYLFYHAVARSTGADPSAGITMLGAAAALAVEGQPLETSWPYSMVQTTPWVPPIITTMLYKAAMATGRLSFDGIIAALDQGHPIVLGLIITDAFWRPDASGRIPDVSPDMERAGHAVIAVGHGISADGTQALLVRNSWGAAWSLGGHAWLSQNYVERHLNETAMLT